MTTTADLKTIAGLKHFRGAKQPDLKLETSTHYAAFATIYEDMSDAQKVDKGLSALNECMWGELEARMPSGFRANPAWKAGFDNYFSSNTQTHGMDAARKTKTSYKGVLSSVLKATEKDNGFGEVSYAWGTSAEAFLANLEARRPFKDYTASVTNHGEYTHRIQWWIVCNCVLGHSTYNASYYADCASWSCQLEDAKRKVYLWDFLFDSAFNTTGENDNDAKGRSPIYVFGQCRKDQGSLLGAFLNYRVDKATAFGDMVGLSPVRGIEKLGSKLSTMQLPAGILERAARRFHNKTFADLSQVQREDLCAQLLERGFTNDTGEKA